MSEFERRLAELAEAAGLAARPDSVTGIRARAGRLRARRRAVAVAVAVVVGGATTFAVQAVPGRTGPAPATSVSASPSASGSPAPDPSPSSSVTPSSQPSSPSPSSGPPSAASSASPAVVRACRAADVSIDWSQPVAGSTHRGASLVVTNTGTRSCTVGGYPTLKAKTVGGGPVETARHTVSGYLLGVRGTPDKAIELGPGLSAKVYAEASAINPDTGNSCRGAYVSLFLTLPGDTDPLDVPIWTDDACSSLEVHPFVRVGYGGS